MRELLPRPVAEELLTSIAPRPEGMPSQKWDVCVSYMQGETLVQIARRHERSREWVRLVIEDSPWPVATVRARRDAYRREREDQERGRARAWSVANLGAPLSQGATKLGMDVERLRSLLGHQARNHVSLPLRARSVFTDDDVRAGVAEFVQSTPAPHSMSRYNAWAVRHERVQSQTVVNRLGPWAQLITDLGGRCTTTGADLRRKYTADHAWAAVVDAMRDNPMLTQDEYDRLARTRPAYPSRSLVLNLLGQTWMPIRAEALAILNGRSTRDPAWVQTILAGDVAPPREHRQRSMDEVAQIIAEAIRECGPSLTMQEYDAWANAHDRPTASMLKHHLGVRWLDMVARAGGQVADKRKTRQYDRGELAEVMRQFVQDCPTPTPTQYHRWAKGHPGAPSASAMRRAFDPWAAAVEQARHNA